MAFNPFRAFRKHQKVFFAGLTILCMVTFVLTGSISAGWDFFQGLLPAFGLRGKGTEAAKVYGQYISPQELQHIRQQRVIANLFMRNALEVSNQNGFMMVAKALAESKIDKPIRDQIEQILSFRMLFRQPDSQFGNFLREKIGQLDSYRRVLQKPEDAQLVLQVEELLDREMFLGQHATDTYFGGSMDGPGLIDFLIWKHQADRLGIQFTDKEIAKLFAKETFGRVSADDQKAIIRFLQNRYGTFTPDMLLTALADEFRVRMAQETLMGMSSASSGGTPAVTPFAFWKFYEKERTESEVVLLPIRVDSPEFLKKVGEPNEQDLKSLFERRPQFGSARYGIFYAGQGAKEREPDPASAQAGFKQPARVTVEWVSARPDMAQFRRAAAVAAAALQATMPLAFDMTLLSSYEFEKYRYATPSWVGRDFAYHASSLNRVENVVALVGQGATVGIGDPALSVSLTLPALAAARDLRYRSERVAALVAAAASPLSLTMLAPLYVGTPSASYLPVEDIKPQLAERFQEELARQLVQSTLKELEDYLTNHSPGQAGQHQKQVDAVAAFVQGLAAGSTPGMGFMAPVVQGRAAQIAHLQDARRAAEAFLAETGRMPLVAAAVVSQEPAKLVAEIKTHVAEVIKRFGLEHGTTERPRDRLELDDDKGLAPLRAAYLRTEGAPQPGSKTRPFSSLFFDSTSPKEVFSPRQLGGFDRFAYWKTGEEPPYVPTFEEAKTRVVQRWKFEKARQLAKDEADKIAAEARKAKGDARRNLEDGSRRFGKLIDLEHVARLSANQSFVPSRVAGRTYEPYKVPETAVEYPSEGFVDKLLDLKEPGEVTVLHDRPEATYYVATLDRRSEPLSLSFYVDAAQPDALLQYWERDTKYREKFRESCLNQLREEARVEYNEEALKAFTNRGMAEEE